MQTKGLSGFTWACPKRVPSKNNTSMLVSCHHHHFCLTVRYGAEVKDVIAADDEISARLLRKDKGCVCRVVLAGSQSFYSFQRIPLFRSHLQSFPWSTSQADSPLMEAGMDSGSPRMSLSSRLTHVDATCMRTDCLQDPQKRLALQHDILLPSVAFWPRLVISAARHGGLLEQSGLPRLGHYY